jgi:hypothetical protein
MNYLLPIVGAKIDDLFGAKVAAGGTSNVADTS